MADQMNEKHPYKGTLNGLRVAIDHLTEALQYGADEVKYLNTMYAAAKEDLADEHMDYELARAFADALEDLAERAESKYDAGQSTMEASQRRAESLQRSVERDQNRFQVKHRVGASDTEQEMSDASTEYREERTEANEYRHDLAAITTAMRMVAAATENEELEAELEHRAAHYEPEHNPHGED